MSQTFRVMEPKKRQNHVLIKNKNKKYIFSLFIIALTATLTQLLIIKELMDSFYGNEFSYITIFVSWLILLSIGANLCKRFKISDKKLLSFHISLGILPLATIIAIRWLRNLLFPIGTLVALQSLFLFSLLILFPFCILYGCLLSCIPKALNQRYKSISKSYYVDNLGNVFGALIFTFFLGYLLNNTTITIIALALNLIMISMIHLKKRAKQVLLITFIILLTILLLRLNLETFSLSKGFPGQQIILTKNSKFGNYILTKIINQHNLYQNGQLIYSSNDKQSSEELVHYAMLQLDNPKTIFTVPNGNPDLVNEVLKYNIKEVYIIEPDKTLTEILNTYFNLTPNDKIQTISRDALQFLKETNKTFDVIILNLPEPASLEFNRFYSQEFFHLLKKRTNNRSIVIFPLGVYSNYLNEKTKLLYSTIKQSLNPCFKFVKLIPGSRVYFIASNSNVSTSPVQLINKVKERNISNLFVNEYYLTGQLTPDRIAQLNSETNMETPPNLNFKPRAFFLYSLNWLQMISLKFWVLFFLIISSFIGYLILFVGNNSKRVLIFSSGIVASAIEIVAVLSFQIIAGTLYYSLGLLISAALLGMTSGGLFAYRNLKKLNNKTLVNAELLIAIALILLPLIIKLLSSINSQALTTLLLSSSLFIIYFLIGLEFPAVAKISFENESKTSAELYSLDFMGALFGAIITALILIPLFGLLQTSLILAALKFCTTLFVKFKN